MSFRTVVLTKDAKISLRLNSLVVKSDVKNFIPLKEIDVLLIENPNIVMTGHLLNALSNMGIIAILCDNKHMPTTYFNSVYSHSRQSKNIRKQINWKNEHKQSLWRKIVKEKIMHQAKTVKKQNENAEYDLLLKYADEVELNDHTNREAYAAKVYFSLLFGSDFLRAFDDDINSALNYGYTLLNAAISRQIVSKGYLTQIGVNHRSEYNHHNLSSDLIEIFRPLIDGIVVENIEEEFNKEFKRELLSVFDLKVKIDDRKYYLNQAISIFLDGVFLYLETGDSKKLKIPEW